MKELTPALIDYDNGLLFTWNRAHTVDIFTFDQEFSFEVVDVFTFGPWNKEVTQEDFERAVNDWLDLYRSS